MDLARPNADLSSAFLCALGDSVVSRCAERLEGRLGALRKELLQQLAVRQTILVMQKRNPAQVPED